MWAAGEAVLRGQFTCKYKKKVNLHVSTKRFDFRKKLEREQLNPKEAEGRKSKRGNPFYIK